MVDAGVIDDNEWYDFDHNITDQSDRKDQIHAIRQGRRKQNKLRKKFDKRFKVVEKDLEDDQKPNPMASHKMSVVKRKTTRDWMKTSLGIMKNITKKIVNDVGKPAFKLGLMALTSLDGYQGPYKFIPDLTKSEAWDQYQKQRQERYYSGLMGGRSSDTGTPSRPTKQK